MLISICCFNLDFNWKAVVRCGSMGIRPRFGFDFSLGSSIQKYLYSCYSSLGWNHLNHQTTVCLRKSLSVERDPSVQLSDDSWSHQRNLTATASHKTHQTMAGRGCESSGDELYTNIFKQDSLDWRWAWGGVHPFPVFTSQLSVDEGLCVPTPLMTQNLWAATNTVIQYSIMSKMEVVQPMHPLVHLYWRQHHLIICGDQKWCQWLCVSRYEHNGMLRVS